VSKAFESLKPLRVLRGSVPRRAGDDTRKRSLTSEATSGPFRRLASTLIQPTFATPERWRTAQASQDEINAPWEDLFSAVGRKPPPVEPAKPSATLGDPPPEPDADRSVRLPPPAAQPEPLPGPLAQPQAMEPLDKKSQRTKAARRRAERLEKRAKTGEDRLRRQIPKSIRSSAQARSRVEPVRRQRPSRLRTARERRRTRPSTSDLAPSPSVQLPQGLTPKHATPRD
jgi:hypothetical protein